MKRPAWIVAAFFATTLWSVEVYAQPNRTQTRQQMWAVCQKLQRAMGDAAEMAQRIADAEDQQGALQIGTVAQLNGERCLGAYGLLYMAELVPAGANQREATKYLAMRLDIYASALKTDIRWANEVMGAAHTPGLTRQAESFRNSLREFGEVLVKSTPK